MERSGELIDMQNLDVLSTTGDLNMLEEPEG